MLAVALLAVSPASALGFAKAIWGPGFSNGTSNFPIYRQLRVSIYEDVLYWNQVAPTRPRHPTDPNDPAYQWPATLQQNINEAAAFHMQVAVQFYGTPAWASGGRSYGWSPLHASDFAAFAAATARRYPTVHLWMIWGEPNRQGHFEPIVRAKPYHRLNAAQQVAPRNYARVVDAAYAALKAVSRANLVIGGNTYTGGYVDTQQWIANMRLPNGRPPRMDLYGHNPFGFRPPTFAASASPFGEVQFADLPRLARWVDRYLGRGMPLFISEWDIPTAPDQEFPFWVNARVAAQWIARAMHEARSWKRIYAFGWVHLYDDPPLTNGGLLTARGARKPLFAAFARG
jgi:hypothetical protein